ncbi:MAG: single-stranded-DNA-specific exonuclease RecJ [Oscillospiraceae bacterium]|nr:single-stranded-DNA-specific exonuclease RecJ [Oscillospiraceae bacterium]
MSKKKWLISSCDKELAKQAARKHDLNPFAALLAVSRGIKSDGDIAAFFGPGDASLLSDPFIYKDMDKAADRITRAIDNFEMIAIFGDYDADGVTATALLSSYLETREANFFCRIPTRDEGYGLTNAVIDELHSRGAKLIVTVDNGIGSVGEALYASSLGIDMVITDHHRAGDEIPKTVAVVDPFRPDCLSEFKNLAGVGVAFKLICALDSLGSPFENGSSEFLLSEYADLISIGTVADIMPLINENRVFVRAGIVQMNDSPRVGISAMLNTAGKTDRTVSSQSVAYMIAPRLNAAGRVGSAERAFEILMCDDPDRAALIAEEIEAANAERQQVEQHTLDLAEEQLTAHPEYKNDRVIVCDGNGWNNGVIGIVASRLVERYGKPCIVISRDGDTAKGSGRSLRGFSLYDAIYAVSGCLIRFGGHVLAAGLMVESDQIDAFRKAINDYAKGIEMPFPIQRIDFRLNPQYIGTELLEALDSLEPFGSGNPQPVVGLFNMKIDSVTPLSNGKHLRLAVSKNNTALTCVYFGETPERFPYESGSVVDLAVVLTQSEYMGETKVSVQIKDIRLSAISQEEHFLGLRAYADIQRGETPDYLPVEKLVPDRKLIAAIYMALRGGGRFVGTDMLCAETGCTGAEVCAVLIALDALCELGLVSVDADGHICLTENQNKVNLDDSRVLARVKEIAGS